MAKKKKVEEVYRLTFKGLLTVLLRQFSNNAELADQLYDEIELHMRRNYSKTGVPALVLDVDTDKLEFTSVELNRKGKK